MQTNRDSDQMIDKGKFTTKSKVTVKRNERGLSTLQLNKEKHLDQQSSNSNLSRAESLIHSINKNIQNIQKKKSFADTSSVNNTVKLDDVVQDVDVINPMMQPITNES